MLDYTNCFIQNMCVHRVGNKTHDEELHLSKTPLDISDGTLKELLMQYFLKPFAEPEFFSFILPVDTNVVGNMAKQIFEDTATFYDNSVQLARHLFDLSMDTQLKSGELFVVYFSDVVLEDELVDAVGIFKSENRHPFLKLDALSEEFKLDYDDGINIDKLDKGCLIFNKEQSLGYRICMVDKANKSEGQFWKNDFLQIQPCSDNYHYTKDFMTLTKTYLTKQLAEDFDVTKTDKIDMMNRTVDYFKTHESFDKSEFESEVFQTDEMIEAFRDFDENYRESHEVQTAESFDISEQAVKKQARSFKSVLKLDKNFHVYIHGDRSLIERGTEGDGRKFYKIYFDKEV